MISWRGVPDFSQQLELPDFTLFPAGDGANLFVYLPKMLRVAPAEGGGGGPDFSLELVFGQNPFQPPQPYGVLDFRLCSEPFNDAALEALRLDHPGAAVTPALFTSGWLRIVKLADNGAGSSASSSSAGGTDSIAASSAGTIADSGQVSDASGALATPVALASNGLDGTRYVRRLSLDEFSIAKSFLQQAVFSYTAWAEMTMEGLTESLPASLEFRPAALLAALRQQADSQGRLPISQLVEFWMQDKESLPLTASEGFDSVERIRLAQTLADWTLAECAVSVPSPSLPIQPTCQLSIPQTLAELARWDLRQQRLVPRVVLLQLDPFEAARQVAATVGLQSVVHETVVPPLETGVVSLTIAANLPEAPQGILHLGVNLLALPTPPQRVQALSASLLFDEPKVKQTVNWRFSPIETVSYQYTTFVYLREAGVIRRLDGPATKHSGPYLLLGVADFPLGFVPVRASELLLSQAVIKGVCVYTDSIKGATEFPFELDAKHPAMTVVLPTTALPDALIRLQACALGGTEVLFLDDLPPRGGRLDLPSFPQYGPHEVPIKVDFDTGTTLVALEFLPQANSGQPETATVLAFTPGQPQATWHYLATSPFQAGYQYRRQAGADERPLAWTSVGAPPQALKLKTSQL
jgi:hypothetical protein